eukprot:TRINITY_DN2187_c0_g1_i1.p1 TRINITY_DN2187_c0_g1~~TRINITY_DN2187_c0_g1_i1.p1  ORF type:complete len:546 (-),score=99.66 TRINITY_DN2187_c0_g1_i1:146-1783(-)
MSRTYTLEEITSHKTEESCWIIINNEVYDVTSFLNDHPGGKKILVRVGGQDASKQFANFHDVKSVLAKYGNDLRIGTVGKSMASMKLVPQPKEQPAPPQKSQPQQKLPPPKAQVENVKPTSPDYELVPFGDSSAYQGWHSPYYNESHYRLRDAVRKFVDEELMPHSDEWDRVKTFPIKKVAQKAAAAGILPCVVGHPFPEEYAGSFIAGGVKPSEYDPFHEFVIQNELCRTGGYVAACGWYAGLSIGLPPVLYFGSQELKDRIAGPCLRGEKIICLAITEPTAGSDVAKISCEAKLSPCGKFFIVNGEKKWITNGIYADYFTTAVRTGEGRNGVSVLLIERGPGVTTKQMDCMGLTASGTTYITFEDVRVPVSNLLGQLNKGFTIIMHNFNHERMGTNMQANRFARVCYTEAFKYACKRETFGKPLIDHPVIREKLAHMIKKIESTHALIESVLYQLKIMSFAEAQAKLGGVTALLKSQATETFEFCAREASQIFGGLAYTKGGQGAKIERLFREARVFTVFAGSEEIMLDLGVRQAAREYFSKL